MSLFEENPYWKCCNKTRVYQSETLFQIVFATQRKQRQSCFAVSHIQCFREVIIAIFFGTFCGILRVTVFLPHQIGCQEIPSGLTVHVRTELWPTWRLPFKTEQAPGDELDRSEILSSRVIVRVNHAVDSRQTVELGIWWVLMGYVSHVFLCTIYIAYNILW